MSASRRCGAARLVAAVVSAAGALGALFLPAAPSRQGPRPPAARLELGPGPDLSGFERVTAPRAWRLPEDHGPHFAFQTEWWYFTGQLASREGRRFGFQLTFFRRGLSPGPPPAGDGLATNQVYFAHFAVADVARGVHRGVERFARGAAGLAGATPDGFGTTPSPRFAVWLEDWRAQAASAPSQPAGPEPPWRLTARDAESGLELDLELQATKPLVAHGERGLSPKSDEPGNASFYLSYTRLSARGLLGADGVREAVAGEAWFDHEWSTSALGAEAVGWDWFSLQLDDGRELVLFLIRRSDGTAEPVSSGTVVSRDGSARHLRHQDASLEVLGRWTSPHTGAVYPAAWRIRVPSEDLVLTLRPLLADQEMRTSFLYWEGAVNATGTAGGLPVSGRGYVELTGYARSMRGLL